MLLQQTPLTSLDGLVGAAPRFRGAEEVTKPGHLLVLRRAVLEPITQEKGNMASHISFYPIVHYVRLLDMV